MNKPAARINDKHNCPKRDLTPHGNGSIMTGSPNVKIGGQPAARLGDVIRCADGSKTKISQSHACVLINNKLAARRDDKTHHGGVIMTGFNTVLISNGKPFALIGDLGTVEIGENVSFTSYGENHL